jgi:hypothetical protein
VHAKYAPMWRLVTGNPRLIKGLVAMENRGDEKMSAYMFRKMSTLTVAEDIDNLARLMCAKTTKTGGITNLVGVLKRGRLVKGILLHPDADNAIHPSRSMHASNMFCFMSTFGWSNIRKFAQFLGTPFTLCRNTGRGGPVC